MIDSLQQELAQKGVASFYVRARPSASTTRLVEVMDDESLKVDLAAPPVDGKANIELIKLLSKEFGVPKNQIEIVSGQTAKHKLVRITR